jgi:ribonuclease P protein component
LSVYVRASGRPEARLGLVVRARDAVTRNRVKRRLRAAVGEAGPRGGTDVVIRADDRAVGRDFQEMVAIVRAALRAEPRR